MKANVLNTKQVRLFNLTFEQKRAIIEYLLISGIDTVDYSGIGGDDGQLTLLLTNENYQRFRPYLNNRTQGNITEFTNE